MAGGPGRAENSGPARGPEEVGPAPAPFKFSRPGPLGAGPGRGPTGGRTVNMNNAFITRYNTFFWGFGSSAPQESHWGPIGGLAGAPGRPGPGAGRGRPGPGAFKTRSARPTSHVYARPTLQKLNELGYETLPHPPYSPDLSPTDYHFFKHLDNLLQEKCFKNQDDAKTAFADFIASRTPDFYATGINKLVSRWQKCVDSNGFYFD
ncbi:unnamed protein product [Bursaphelenchus xylophilus]|uniref:(pine wood nematode) hypothetical protein n=1 Tax=Bursaphelenchus xylophilus TaxID=6326 RepID=A0A7I8WG42_BURXY|nr:unnamed protein product [Bursaphelenchus xylophilus]CAG9111443.1 unnamed protein product [Bursaphelenchus xylophilus]